MQPDKHHSQPPIAISVVIPVYRSEATLDELYSRIVQTLEPLVATFEIVFVEDCGGDNAWDVIQRIAASDPRVRGFKLSRNFGQHAATICGFSHAKGQWVATIDDDLEQAPELLSALYQKAQEGYDLVYGIYPERSHTVWRNKTSDLARWLFKKAIPSLNDQYTSLRFIRGDIARELERFDSPFPFIDGYLSWLTNHYAVVEAPHHARQFGKSNYTFRKLVTHTINIFVSFSDMPLKFASWLGIGTFLIGMCWLGILLLRYLMDGITVSGFASIMTSILVFGGVQLFVMGVFGEYLGRMNFKLSRKPLFLVGSKTPPRNH
jgi:polyisoprenyl-phosphate glycosyltransferase